MGKTTPGMRGMQSKSRATVGGFTPNKRMGKGKAAATGLVLAAGAAGLSLASQKLFEKRLKVGRKRRGSKTQGGQEYLRQHNVKNGKGGKFTKRGAKKT
jgi:hypothetical protein